jgi:hypothetical protein
VLTLLASSGAMATQPGASRESTPSKAQPAVSRGGSWFGVSERFNRYYTDPAWQPLRTVYVSPGGGGDGSSRNSPTTPQAAADAAKPGDLIQFTAGTYTGSGGSAAYVELDSDHSGTYDQPIVLRADRGPGGEYQVTLENCGSRACINLEYADYVAVDGFNMTSGRRGTRFVGDLSDRNVGGLVMNSQMLGLDVNGVFTGFSDWFIVENNNIRDSANEHGIYISNGSDFGIVRSNRSAFNDSTGLQINADPLFVCEDVSNAQCYGSAKNGQGDGVSEFWLIDNNYFHNNRIGINLTSVRKSRVFNNIVAWNTSHGVALWQEVMTDGSAGSGPPEQMDPNYGDKGMKVAHNLFAQTSGSNYALQIISWAKNPVVRNNVFIGSGGSDPLLDLDSSTTTGKYTGNLYAAAASIDGTRTSSETVIPEFDPAWYENWDPSGGAPASSLRPAPVSSSPLLSAAPLASICKIDMFGTKRSKPLVDRGPIEVP